MNTNHKSIEDIHHEHDVWNNELSFYKVETNLFNKRLGRLLKKEDKDFYKQVEHFQNEFILQSQAASELRDKVAQYEKLIASYAEKNQSNILLTDDQYMEDHTKLHKEVNWFKKLYQELKMEYNDFSVKHL